MKERPKEIMTITLIGINILVFIVLTMIGRTEDGYFMLQHGAMYEPYIIENQEYYRLFTSLFLHFGISHLLNNMVLLWALGSIFEKEAGKIRFLRHIADTNTRLNKKLSFIRFNFLSNNF